MEFKWQLSDIEIVIYERHDENTHYKTNELVANTAQIVNSVKFMYW